ncbi:thiol reductant ABC exporter subunit CydD [Streptomyces sulfonofaciens]|uniref:thiol reductant ABC exporter subunit CydD n=1 Tax=Streptomyces sulfonofaciens TaxID=68272 RepID=UPI001676E4B3|nr:thiol reductant ABC exporter subunit CydD [Streptomyces sulfonofaciens]
MKPVDPRLLRYARATRFFLVAVVVLGLAGAGLVVAQAMLIADVVVGAFQHGLSVGELREPLTLLVVVAMGRGAVGWLTEHAAHRASAAVKSELRGRLLERVGVLGPQWLGGQHTGSLVALATRGVDALDDYFARYLPQLGLAVVVPAAVLARIVTEDWLSAVIIAGTLPLIPVFMVLIGWSTQSRMDRQWRLLSRLSGHFLDVVAGLPTLKVFGRAKAQAESIRRITGAYRRATMRTLRIAFLSSFALELLATLSVALVAVTIGMRLVHGELDLHTGLLVLVLAPEAYLPVRQVGAQYHAAAEGLAAAEDVFAVLDTMPETVHKTGTPEVGKPLVPMGAPAGAGRPGPGGGGLLRGPWGIRFDGVSVRYPGRSSEAVSEMSFEVRPGETVALVGPSGAGKSTLVSVALGLVRPTAGRVRAGGADLAEVPLEEWHRQVAWVPQRPHLHAGSIAENVRLARPGAATADVRGALHDAGALEFVDALPDGVRTVLGEDGAGLSAGQRQRIALARAFLADRPVLVLDEPTASLDGATEADVVAAVRRLAHGRTVLLVAHRPALLAAADRVVRIPGPATDADPAARRTDGAPVGQPVPERSWTGRGDAGIGTGAGAGGGVGGTEDGVPPRVGGGADGAAPPAAEAAGTGGAAVLRRVRRMAAARRGQLVAALALGALALGSAVGLMGTSGWLISRAAERPPVLYLMVAVTATRAFGIGRAAFRYAERLVSHDTVLRILADARVTVYRGLERLAPAGLRTVRRGDLLSRLVADVEALQDYWLRWLLPVAAAVLVSMGTVAFTAWLLPSAGAVLATGLLVAGVGVPLLAAAVARRAERRLAPVRGMLATRVADLLTGTAELTVAGALPARTALAKRADTALTRIAARAAAATALGSGLTALVSGLTVAGTALCGVTAVREGRLDGVALAVVVLVPTAAFEALLGLPLAARHRQRVRRSAERVYEVLDAPVPVREPAAPAAAPATPFPLRLRGLAARYAERPGPGTGPDPVRSARPRGTGVPEGDALFGLDLTLERGRRVAVVGPSGAGKSTLAQVLLRFLDAYQGTYTLGGVDAYALDGDTVRRHVGLCAQDAHTFDSSVRENLLLARKEATEDQLRHALARVRLLDWAESLPDGLDTLVGEHGARLSGGQRQRLALARALLADFPVLVLDEPAEHLDLPTGDALTADLLAATEGRTTLLITHRLTGLEAVDEVLVLDGGRVVQRGRYAELVAVEGPLRRLWERERASGAESAALG